MIIPPQIDRSKPAHQQEDPLLYAGVKEEDADRIVDQHLKQGETLTPLIGKVDKGLEELIYQLLDSGIF